MTYKDYESKYEALMKIVLEESEEARALYPNEFRGTTGIPFFDTGPDSVMNQLTDLEETYPRHASRYEKGTGGPYSWKRLLG